MLLTSKVQRSSSFSGQLLETGAIAVGPELHRHAGDSSLTTGWSAAWQLPAEPGPVNLVEASLLPCPQALPQEVDPLYLFACHIEWEQREEPSAAWELLAAAQSSNNDTRAHARSLLASSQHLGGTGLNAAAVRTGTKRYSAMETNMNVPYDLEIVEDCTECSHAKRGFFCGFSDDVLQALNQISQRSTLPAGAILFVEGQAPRGIFVLCAGKVNLSTASREGKMLMLKTAEAGQALGLSATIAGMGYEATAETATPCHLAFVERKAFLEFMESNNEVGLRTAQCLSRDFRSAHRDIHDLILTRSSTGKLARLLLALSVSQDAPGEEEEIRVHSLMTHEEMAHRIGASRETVTRLLGDLKKKRLIRLDGPTLVIRDRPGLEALTI